MKPKARKNQSLDELLPIWEKKLADSGFVDIEDTTLPDRPLKDWHSHRFRNRNARIRQANREKYDRQIADFLNASHINEICSIIVSHGNCSIGPKRVKKILELYNNGESQRKIAKKVRCGKKAVHLTLKKAKEWMKVA